MLDFLSDLAREYGDVVRFRLGKIPFCLVNDPELIRRIVVTDNALFTKSHGLSAAKKTLGEGLLTSEGELHKKQRRLINPVFHAQQVKNYAAEFVTQAQRTAEHWRDGQTIDLNEAMTELTLRVVTKTLFGTELVSEVGQIGRDMGTLVTMFERVRNPIGFLLNRLPLPSNRRFSAALKRIDARVHEMIRTRKQQLSDDPNPPRFDLLSLLLLAQDSDGSTMSPQQVRDEAVTLFIAGHETTANALIWTWLLLAEHPQVEAKLREELDEVLQDGRAATADDVPRLKYTRAALSESMRLRPPAWVIARKNIDDYTVGDYVIRAGTTFLMSQFLVHRDARWWGDDAAEFRPDRWFEEAGARPKYAYFPFGGGERSCVGEPFAWMEAIILLATIAQRWKMSRVDQKRVRLFPTITLRPRDAVAMQLRQIA